LANQPLRNSASGDNGVRILDVDNDGYMDVVIANDRSQSTRVWAPRTQSWSEMPLPSTGGARIDALSATFAVLGEAAAGPTSLVAPARAENSKPRWRGWDFDGQKWIPARWIDGLARVTGELGSALSDPASSRPRLLFRD